MRVLAPALFVFIFAASGYGQAICNLSISDLPPIHGIQLGTTRQDFDFVFAATKESSSSRRSATPDLTNIEEIWTGFFHGRLASVEFDYDRNTEWKNVRQFATHLERRLKLPLDSWVFVGETEAMMVCKNFKAAISSVRNTFSLTDIHAKAAAQQELRQQPQALRKRVY